MGKIYEPMFSLQVITYFLFQNVSESYFKRILGWSKNYVRAETVFAKDMFPDAEQSVHYHKT